MGRGLRRGVGAIGLGAVACAALGVPTSVAAEQRAAPRVVELTPQPVIDGTGYVPVGLGDFGAPGSEALGINDAGVIVGFATSPIDGETDAVRWVPGAAPEPLESDVGDTAAFNINANGTITGWSFAPERAGYTWAQDGTRTTLDTTPGAQPIVLRLNSDLAVGYEDMSLIEPMPPVPDFVPVAWDIAGGARHTLEALAVDDAFAYGINAAGIIVGESGDALGDPRAVAWTDTTSTPAIIGPPGARAAVAITDDGLIGGRGATGAFVWDLALDTGTILSNAVGVNDLNSGGVGVTNLDFILTPAIWRSGEDQLFALAGARPRAEDINESGAVVGSLQTVPGAPRRAVRWELRSVAFPDVAAANVFGPSITGLVLLGTITGYPDGTFRPTAEVTRQMFAAFLYRAMGWMAGQSPACDDPFTDITAANQFCGHISWGAAEDLLHGFPDGTYRPTSVVTRQTLVAMLYRAAGSPEGADPTCLAPPFVDVPVSHDFCGEIAWAHTVGLVGGYPDGTFRPTGAVTRQVVAGVLADFHDLLVAAA